tara:strand:- start:198 stop:716 length:519 start_codon:yes stop_codon:yes gene_type:complete
MALQTSGQISLSNITEEMGFVNTNVSLGGLSTNPTLNDESPYKPNESQPHKMSEFYRYDHNYSSVEIKSIGSSGGQLGKWFEFCESAPKFTYYWAGEKEAPVLGDYMFSDSKGDSPLPKGFHFTLATGERIATVVFIGNEGEITTINSCEGIEPRDPKDPGLPSEPEGPRFK